MGRVVVPATVGSTDGVELRIHDLGGEGPLLLLCHATGFCGPMFAPVAEVLGRRFHCVTFDFRAHGRSTRPSHRPLEWDGMADDVVAVVEALSPDAAVPAVGHSMGGSALALAEAARPGTIERAWTFEPILFERTSDIVGPQPSPISTGARRRRATFASRDEAAERYRSRPPLDRLDERVMDLYLEHGFEELADGRVTLRCRPEDEASVFEHHHTTAGSAIGRLGIPFLIAISGDGERPAEAGRATAEATPGVELVVYRDLSHFGPLQEPDRLAADIDAWLP
jgi:pimeloyl-ACP methyl ester carboxylesterase